MPPPRRKRILFFSEAVTLAHAARPVVLAQSLDPTEYVIHLAWDPRYAHLFGELPFRVRLIYSIPSEQFLHALANGSPVFSTDTLRRYVKEDLQIIKEISPDVIVGDFRLSLAVSARVTGIPYITITNAYWSPYARQHFPVPDIPLTRIVGVSVAQKLFNVVRPLAFAYHTMPLNTVRREYGLSNLGYDLRRIYTEADYVLYADIPELVPVFDAPENHQYVGHILWSPKAELPEWWDDLPNDKPIIYVTMGSSGARKQLRAVLEAISELPVVGIVATAGRPQSSRQPSNVLLADYLPGDKAAARASIVICNGGSPSTQQALEQGTPILGLPCNLDQYLNMGYVERAGAGMAVRSHGASATEIQRAVNHLLRKHLRVTQGRKTQGAAVVYQAEQVFPKLLSAVC